MNLRQLVGKRQPLVYALLGVIACVCNLGMAELDDDPKTSPDWGSVVAVVLVAVGAAKARQNNVSSEDAGAVPGPESCDTLTGTYNRLGVFAAIAAIGLLTLAGCATTDQPTTQDQPTQQGQTDEQWADLRNNATINLYFGGAAKKGAVLNGDSVSEATPGELAGVGQHHVTFDRSPISVTVTVTTHGQSEKQGTQTGPAATSNSTATPTNTPNISPDLNIPVNLTPGAGSSVNLGASAPGSTGNGD
jgi:hypothetical protein